jgi:hypothetical protein
MQFSISVTIDERQGRISCATLTPASRHIPLIVSLPN